MLTVVADPIGLAIRSGVRSDPTCEWTRLVGRLCFAPPETGALDTAAEPGVVLTSPSVFLADRY